VSQPLLSEDQLTEIDSLLFANNPLRAVKRIREITGLGVHKSGDIMHERYRELRERYADKFSLTDEEYWSGWYS
jgi:hypothetical protein